MKLIRLLPLAVFIIALTNCIEETIDVKNLSHDIAFERQIAMPILKAGLTFEDIAGSYDSLIIGIGDTIFLYLNQDIGFHDTIDMTDMGENIIFDFLNIHYEITNFFPIGLSMNILLYDSTINQNLDTIYFADSFNNEFIQPAPVDANGMAIIDEVQTADSYIGLDPEIFDNLFGGTTHLIMDAVVPSTGGFIKVLRNHKLQLNLGIEARGRYITSSDSILNFN